MKIGIDIGGSHIGIGLVDENGNIVEKYETDINGNEIIKNNENNKCNEKSESNIINKSDEQSKDNINDKSGDINNKSDNINNKSSDLNKFIENYILQAIKKLSKEHDIELIGIASPGTPKDGKLTNLVNLGIDELDITKIIKKEFNGKIQINNDAKCAGLAEKQYGSLKDYDDAVFMCLGTGIGGAVFLGGKELKPKRNPGFEIGHMIIKKDGILCNCGKCGCFETYCSMKRLKNALIDAMGLNKDINAKELLNVLKERNKNLKEHREELNENLKQNKDELNERCKNLKEHEEKLKKRNEEVVVQKNLEEYIDNLIIGLSNIIDLLEPEAICLGGSFVYFKDILYEMLLEEFNSRKYVFNKSALPVIKLATLGNDAGIIGATIVL